MRKSALKRFEQIQTNRILEQLLVIGILLELKEPNNFKKVLHPFKEDRTERLFGKGQGSKKDRDYIGNEGAFHPFVIGDGCREPDEVRRFCLGWRMIEPLCKHVFEPQKRSVATGKGVIQRRLEFVGLDSSRV